MGVDKKETGSGDIGIMFGGAVREAPQTTPAGRTICPGFYLTSFLMNYQSFQRRGIFNSIQKRQVIEHTLVRNSDPA